VDVGSSYLPGEITAAFLAGQIEEADSITARRLQLWSRYHEFFAAFEESGRLRRPIIPQECEHNAHMYYLLLNTSEERSRFIEQMKGFGVQTVFHYIPLHSAPAGQEYGRAHGDLEVSNAVSERLVRLPLWVGLEEHLPHILDAAGRCLA
jgi:dTDP-4-amino-4,6-dideoxygalactose transaminase